MTIPATVLVELATLGLAPEQAAKVANMLTAVEAATAAASELVVAASREKTRLRVATWRANKAGNVTERNVTVRNGSRGGVTRAEDKTSISEIEPQEESKNSTAKASGLAEFRSDLAPDLDAERLGAFIAVRKAKRGAMTGYAARLFRADAERCGLTLSQAADECIRSSWITVKPEYFAGRQQRAGPALAVVKDTPANAARRRIEAIENERRNGTTDDHQPAPRLLSGYTVGAGR